MVFPILFHIDTETLQGTRSCVLEFAHIWAVLRVPLPSQQHHPASPLAPGGGECRQWHSLLAGVGHRLLNGVYNGHRQGSPKHSTGAPRPWRTASPRPCSTLGMCATSLAPPTSRRTIHESRVSARPPLVQLEQAVQAALNIHPWDRLVSLLAAG